MQLLLEIHQQWYDEYSDGKLHHAKKRPNVTQVISRMKKQVLRGCELTFSGLIPLHETPESAMVWTMAEDFGARCHRTLNDNITHLVATSPHTSKAQQAFRKQKIQVVWPSWLNDSICRWVRQGEVPYLIPQDTQISLASLGAQEVDSVSADEGNDPNAAAVAMDASLANMDWGEAEDEVDAFLDDDEEEDENEDQDKENRENGIHASWNHHENRQGGNESDADDYNAGTAEADAPSETNSLMLESDQDSLLLSPLSKRRRIAALRGGKSKLREKVHVDDEPEERTSSDTEPVSTKRRKLQDSKTIPPSHVEQLKLREQTASPAPSEEILDDLALEMEKELGEDIF